MNNQITITLSRCQLSNLIGVLFIMESSAELVCVLKFAVQCSIATESNVKSVFITTQLEFITAHLGSDSPYFR